MAANRTPRRPFGGLAPRAKLDVPDRHVRFLCDVALREIALLTPSDVFPGPFTYKRFRVRDSALILPALLCAGAPDWFELLEAVARSASSTGQWPEAVHPRTGGGCMGDGQHMWAAAEWVMALRNAFLREEKGRLILASGAPRRWLESGEPTSFGPAPTPWGDVLVSLQPTPKGIHVRWQGQWRADPPRVEVRLEGFQPIGGWVGSGSAPIEYP